MSGLSKTLSDTTKSVNGLKSERLGCLLVSFYRHGSPMARRALTGEAEQIAEDAKQFAPEAERLYQEGERSGRGN